jgi:hypothetical protein
MARHSSEPQRTGSRIPPVMQAAIAMALIACTRSSLRPTAAVAAAPMVPSVGVVRMPRAISGRATFSSAPIHSSVA